MTTKVYIMDGGILRLPSMFLGPGRQGFFDASLPYVYIDHPEAKILLDTGANHRTWPYQDLAEKGIVPKELEMKVIQFEEQRLESCLNRLGVNPREIDLLVPSHLHIDHIGFNSIFPNAKCIVQREELRHAFVPEKFEDPYSREHFDLPNLKYECIDGDYNLFQNIEILHTPGHSAGHQCIAVHLEKSGTLLFLGDLVYFKAMLEGDAFPYIFWSPSMTDWSRSVDKIRSYVKKTDAKVLIYHDREDILENWKYFPEYYD